MILLAVLTVGLVVATAVVLVVYLFKIRDALVLIGGDRIAWPLSLLARARWGVRAIERQTAGIGPQVARLIETLGATADGLAALDEGLGELQTAVREQGEGR